MLKMTRPPTEAGSSLVMLRFTRQNLRSLSTTEFGRLFLRERSWLAILDLAAGDIDHELGKLGGVAGTLELSVCHFRRT
jgi:hypothetical protein